jgi:glycosyltransferase involved in cell wall biosynthesis
MTELQTSGREAPPRRAAGAGPSPAERTGARSAPPAEKLSILLPVRNEGVNLKIMLKILRAVLEVPYELLVIVDSPDDDSIPVMEAIRRDNPRVRLIENRIGRGVVNALRAGVDEARGEYVLIFAADEVGPVLTIEDMLALMDGGCDFVSCTRYAYGGRRLGGSFIGGILSRMANWMMHRLAGCVMTDASTGIKMFRRDVFYRLDLESRPVGWVCTFEMAIKAQLLALRIGEVPIISIDRLYGGKSTFRLGPWAREYFRWFRWGWKRLRRAEVRPPPVRVRVPEHGGR